MRLAPRSLTGQLALLILVAFLVAQFISLWLFTGERGTALQASLRVETAERAAAVVIALEEAAPDNRPGILAAARSHHAQFEVGESAISSEETELPAVRSRVTDVLGSPREIRAEEVGISPRDGRPMTPPAALAWLRDRLLATGVAPTELRLSVLLKDGTWLNVRSRNDRRDFQLPPAILGTILLSLALIMAALWLGLRRITGPLRHLVQAAEEMGIDGPAFSMPRGGPDEVRALSDAMERMQARISGMVADRTRMLAALGHDLRSPITALRLRAEMVDDDETRERMAATLDEMQDMVEATLAYARGVSPDQPMEPTDISRLLLDLASELSETGPQVVLGTMEPVTLPLRRTPMRRALRNLIENAQRYGGGAVIGLSRMGNDVVISIDDTGPGIPDADLSRVFEPFTRLEQSRSRETGGVGLGLPIARAILNAHGGTVELTNRAEGGLRATVALRGVAAREG
ncbi:ATP-binding protein [Neorhizobium petrolearium]|uniref:histidine kinase n=1 Tax=Neorhizobium petrolearium TaxID=515361 RepID=A0ABY8M1N0_9HYPH|nr:ATP-binding protein [Neorhizobium petrolearium]MCC2613374.1 HAMP domain-containing protein [Neorhizobium petrolearium]WGI68455.1 ATP-binding protein [Neorhizobium petrolearium]